ncbi:MULTISPECIES: alpha/beta fold hydrolase [Streptomyces]|uniref:Alpha/beta fold hydrolase n=2 Tax=Streptomyces TaxID=1883 RepID=A0ABV9ILL8_9ACTN
MDGSLPRSPWTSTVTAELVEQVRRIGSGRPCLVVAHSMGGVVATAAAEQAPELLAELMYVTAFAPVNGVPAVQYTFLPENAGERVASGLSADPAAVGALRYDTGDSDRRAAVRDTFYNDDVDEVTAERYGPVPHSYVVCARDNAIRPDLQRLFVSEIDALSAKPTTVVEFDTSHSPFLSRPAALADVIAERLRP